MKGSFEREVFRLQQRRKRKQFWLRTCLLLALAVAVGTFYALSQPARTEEAELICTLAEHVHTDDCFEDVLTCTLEEGEEHQHSESCYTRELVCGLPEHTHSSECYAVPEVKTLELPQQAEVDETAASDAHPDVEAPDALSEIPNVSSGELAEPASGEADLLDTPDGPDAQLPEPEAEDPKYHENLVYDENGEPVPVGTNIAEYIETVSVQRLVNGEYVDSTVFENGDDIRVYITYNIPRGIVTADNKNVYYILPEGISILEESSGDVMDRSTAVGVYTITTTGLIQITFKNKFANGNAISGTVGFTGFAFANSDGSEREIIFDGQGGSIIVTVPDSQKYDLSVAKSGDFVGSGFHTASYRLVVSSEKGTGKEVTIFDQLSVATPQSISGVYYDPSSFSLHHISATGERTWRSTAALSISSGWLSFELPGLPALGPGEKYELTYSVNMTSDPDRSGELHNEAEASTETLSASASYIISYSGDISKQGVYNLTTGLIDWLITVNPDGRDVSGWIVRDELPAPSVGPVYVTTANGSVYATVLSEGGTAIDYTFPDGSPAITYYIQYSTEVLGSEESVTNEVTLINEDTVTVSSTVVVEDWQESVDKQAGARHVELDGTVHTLWSFTVNLPPEQLSSYSFRDNIYAGVTDIELDDVIDGPEHYGIAAEIDAALLNNLHLVSDGKNYYYGDADSIVDFTVVYYHGSEVVSADDSTTHVTRFDVTVTPRNGRAFRGYQIIASDYPTILDASSAVQGDYWSYDNRIRLQSGMRDTATSYYRKGNVFEKQVLFNNAYTNDDVTIGYRDCGGVLNYRLIVDVASVSSDAIEVVDHLPAGLAIVPDSANVNYFSSSMNIAYSGNFAEDGSFTFAKVENEDRSSDITFNAYNIDEDMKSRYVYICISYQARLTDTTKWNDYTEAQETFTNTSSWDGVTSRQDTTVYNNPKRLEKNGVQVLDDSGKPTSVLRYTVVVNAGAEDLDPNSDQLVLVDNVSGNVDLELKLTSISLYKYDKDAPDNLGALVPRFSYLMAVDSITGEMSITLSDEQGYVLIYDYEVNSNEIVLGLSSVTNRVSLGTETEDSVSIALMNVESSATAWQSVVNIVKVDAYNYSKVLEGAEFTLSYRDRDTGSWIAVPNNDQNSEVFVTNEQGLVVLTLTGINKDLSQGLLYRLTETKAPHGYEGSENVKDYYFIIKLDSTADNQDVYQAIAAGSGIEMREIRFFGPTGGSMIVVNRFKGITVVKHWEDADGNSVSNPDAQQITLTLYRTTDPADTANGEPVTGDLLTNPVVVQPDEEGNWQYTWPGMPERLPTGENLYYYVMEADVSGYEAVYAISPVVPGSTLVLTNHMRSFALPMTGSTGTSPLLFVGLALFLFAAISMLRFRRFRRKAARRR